MASQLSHGMVGIAFDVVFGIEPDQTGQSHHLATRLVGNNYQANASVAGFRFSVLESSLKTILLPGCM